MLDPEGAIRAALVDVAERDAPQLAAELIAAAEQHTIPLTILLMWIHDRPRPLRFAPADFLRWAERYRLTNIKPTRQTHPQPAANHQGDAPTDPGRPQLP